MGRRRGGGRPDPGHGQRMHEFLVKQHQARRDRSVPASSASSSAAPTGTLAGFPRTDTLYTSGTAYAPPSNWNPFNLGNYADGHAGAGLRAAVPLRPGQQQVRPVAGHQRQLERRHVHHPGPQRREVERRDAADRRRRRVLDQPGHDQQVRPVQLQRVHGAERHRERQHRDGQVRQFARLQRVAGLPVEGTRRAAAHLVQAFRDPAGHRGQHQAGRHRADAARHLQRHRGRLQGQSRTGGPSASSA